MIDIKDIEYDLKLLQLTREYLDLVNTYKLTDKFKQDLKDNLKSKLEIYNIAFIFDKSEII